MEQVVQNLGDRYGDGSEEAEATTGGRWGPTARGTEPALWAGSVPHVY